MTVCIVCKKRNASFRFPKEEGRAEQWRRILGLKRQPSTHSRICSAHFNAEDVQMSAIGRQFLIKTANPKVRFKAEVTHDHSYSTLSKNEFSGSITLLLTIGPILLCLLPFLLVFCFCLNEDYPRRDNCSSEVLNLRASGFTPVKEGNLFLTYQI